MPFLNIWGRVLHVLVLMLLTRVTRVPMNQRQVIAVVVCGQNALPRRKSVGANEMGQFFVTGATDAAGKPSHFYCRVCRKDVSVLTHGPHEILRHYQGVKHFARDQRLRIETPDWRVLDFEGKTLSESELEWQKEHILRGHLVIRDRGYPLPRI